MITTRPSIQRITVCFCFYLIAGFSIQAQSLYINEFMAANNSTIADESGDYEDWIEIYNGGASSVDLGGYYISDDATDPTLWQIPATEPATTTIPPGGFLLLWADKDTDDGVLHIDIKLGAGGEDIVLTRPDGLITEDQLTFEAQSDDVSYGRTTDGAANFEFFPSATPGSTNEVVSLPDTYTVKIKKAITDGSDDGVQFGVGSGSVNLTGFGIKMVDSWSNQLVGLRFRDLAIPQGANIVSAHLQFTAKDETQGVGDCSLEIKGEDADDAVPFVETGMNFSNRPNTSAEIDWEPVEWLIRDITSEKQKTPDLKAIIQEIVDRPGWDSGNNMAFIISGSGLRSSNNFESSFPAVLHIEIELPDPASALENVYINEIAPNGTNYLDETDDHEDWLELYNDNNFPVAVGGLYLSDDYNDLLQWQISEQAIIPAKGYLTIWADEETYKSGLHADFKLSSEGEELALSQVVNNEIVVLDSFEYGEVPFKASTGRETDGSNNWVIFGKTTPLASNNGAGLYLTPPDISLDNGIYNGSQNIGITHPDPGATILYTTDGTIPTASSTQYANPVSLSDNGSLRAVAFKSGYHPSEPATRSYLFDLSHDLPVLHIVTDPDNLWDDQIGIYTVGTNGTTLGFCGDEEVANYNQDGWERPANITFFETDNSEAFSVNAGIQIGGSCSRMQALKSLNIYLRSNQYGDKEINYQIFPGKDEDKFKRLKLRNSGQDFRSMMFRDAAVQTIMHKIPDLEFQAYRPTVVYINGAYWGIQNLRELYGGEYFEYEEDVKEEDLQLIKNPATLKNVKEGNDIHYRELYQFFESNDISDPANYDYVATQMDIDNFLNYWASMIYISANDWPANNLQIWREDKAGEKWRWMVIDTDASTNHYGINSGTGHFKDKLVRVLNPNVSGWPNDSRSTVFFRGLMDNEAFRNEYIQRTCSFIHLVFAPDKVSQVTDSLRLILDPEIADHIDRWKFDTPFLQSYNAWLSKIIKFNLFFEMRPDLIRSHINNNLNLDGTYELTVAFDANSGGHVLVNTIDLELPYNYEGIYFKNIPLRLTAVADPGYEFAYWLETGVTDAVIDFVGAGDFTLTPVFIQSGPVLTFDCPDDIGVTISPPANTAVVTWTAPDASSTCPEGSVSVSQVGGPDSGSDFPIGSTTITYEATDDCGNVETCAFTIEVNSTSSTLILNCPANIMVTAPEGAGGENVNWTEPEGTSDCIIGSVTTNQTEGMPSGSFFPIGNYTISYEAMDGCGTTESCSFNILVSDGSGTLSLSCPADQTYVLPLGATSIPVNWSLPNASTSCGGGVQNPNCGTTPPGFTSLGSLGDQQYFISNAKKVWTAAQADCETYGAYLTAIGDATEDQFIHDHTNLVVHIGLNDINTEGTYEWINGEPLVYTNFTSSPNNTATNDYGTLVPWDGEWDVYSNQVWKYYVMELDCGGGSSINLTQTGGPANGSSLTAGVYIITYEATDDCGDLQQCSFTVEVQDNLQTIVIDCPADISVMETPGSGAAVVNWAPATTTTTCSSGGLTLTQIAGMPSGSTFPVGLHNITYEAADACGHSETCSFSITVLPDIPTAEYCESKGDQPWQQWIANVTFNTINNDSGKNRYGNFTGMTTNVDINTPYSFSMTPGFSYTQWDEYVRVWIDFNGDSDFEDAGEQVIEQILPAGASGSVPQSVSGIISIPTDAAAGLTRMRVAMQKEAFADPCEIFTFGEVEDYSIVINSNGINFAVGSEILFFDAIKNGRDVRLNWVTNTEYKNDYFVIERSLDGNWFEPVREVQSREECTEERYYQEIDAQPAKGLNYYRFRQVFQDGSFRYSQIKVIDFGIDLERFGLFPNPAKEVIYLNLYPYKDMQADIRIINALGQLVFQKQIESILDHTIRFDLSQYHNGIYNLSVKVKDRKRITRQFVISRLY